MKTLEITGREWVQVENFNQMRHEKGSRRLGLIYWVKMDLDGTIYLVQDSISEKTNVKWLQEAIKMGAIYLERIDYDITLNTALKLSKS